MQGTGDKNGLYETVPRKAGVRARAGDLAKRGQMLTVSALPKDPDPAQLPKLGCMVPAQKLAHIPLSMIALFFIFHKIPYFLKSSYMRTVSGEDKSEE